MKISKYFAESPYYKYKFQFKDKEIIIENKTYIPSLSQSSDSTHIKTSHYLKNSIKVTNLQQILLKINKNYL